MVAGSAIWQLGIATEVAKDLLLGVAAVGSVIVAYLGLQVWKRQLTGERKYRVALQVLRSAYRARDEILAVRYPSFPREFAVRLETDFRGRPLL
jgi:hypothetical protein